MVVALADEMEEDRVVVVVVETENHKVVSRHERVVVVGTLKEG